MGDAEAWGYEVEATYRTRFDYGAVLLMNLGYAKGKGKVTSLGSDIADDTRDCRGYLPFLRPNQIKSSFVTGSQNFSGNNIFAGLSLVASATYTFEEGGVANLTNVACCSPGGRRKLDTVRRLNANIGLNSDKWSLLLRGKNLTDHSYEILSLDSLYLRNEPRFAYVEFNYRF